MTADAMRWPLADRTDDLARIETLSGGSVSAEAIVGLSQLSLRMAPELASRSPLPLPMAPNTVSEAGDVLVAWLGPDEWLVVGRDGSSTLAALGKALAGTHHALVDVSANRAAIELRGGGRLALLASRCGLDLHPRSWREGMCAQSLVGRAQALLIERPEATWVFVRPSFAAYLVDVLVDGAAAAR